MAPYTICTGPTDFSFLPSEELRGIFNRLLATLVAADNGFIALSLANTARIHFFPHSDILHMIGNREGLCVHNVNYIQGDTSR